MKAERTHILHSFSRYFRNAIENGQLDTKTAREAFHNVAVILDDLDELHPVEA